MTEFEIPDTVKEIDGEAFRETQITSLMIPESVVKIEYNSFGCSSITNVKWPSTLKTITGFSGNKALREFIIPDTVISIGKDAFSFCTNLITVHIPNSVTSIGKNAFYSCTNLETIDLPDSITEIGEDAFQYCHSLKRIKIPKGVNYLPYFEGCDNLKTVMISRPLFDKYKSRFDDDTEFVFY